jgi:hypothetical protein
MPIYVRRPLRPGRALRRDSEYERCGTANAFWRGTQGGPTLHPEQRKATADRSSPVFADYLLDIAQYYPGADTTHLVMDNPSSHSRKAVVERFGEKAGGWLWNRFTVHYTPTHGSWLNQAEIEISLFSRSADSAWASPHLSLGKLRRETPWNRK